MKVIAIIMVMLVCSSCKTHNVYVIDRKPVQACSISFTKQPASKTPKADSLFRVASKEAMRKALQ